jgi:hypothetical protein
MSMLLLLVWKFLASRMKAEVRRQKAEGSPKGFPLVRAEGSLSWISKGYILWIIALHNDKS